MHCKHVRWIFDPTDFELLAIEGAGLNRSAIVIRYELAFPGTPADPRPLIGKYIRAGLVASCYQVAWPAVHGDMEFRAGKPRPFNHGFEISCQQSFALAKSRNTHRLEILLEEDAGCI